MLLAAVEFRRAGPDDASAVRQLTREAYQQWCELLGREPKPMTADYEYAVRHHLIDLALIQRNIAGLVEMIDKDDSLLVENLAVHPAHRGQGVGALLMRRAEETAQDLGLPTLTLYTNKLFTSNLQFYSRLGYRFDREEPFKGGYVVHLSKPVRR
jgi:GNAT superfamily N-acetyltransferase